MLSLVLLTLTSALFPAVRSEGAQLMFAVRGTSPGDGFGLAAAAAGDRDGDQVPDLAVGIPVRGQVRFVSGVDGRSLGHEQGGAGFGGRLERADVDGDGSVELLVGPVAGDDRARLVFPDRGGERPAVLLAPAPDPSREAFMGALTGGAVRIGDLDGDGTADVAELIRGEAGERSVRLLSGADGAVLGSLMSDRSDDAFGWSLADAGDVDADGRDDVVIGAPGDDRRGRNAGAAWVFSGRDGRCLALILGGTRGERLGTLVGALGDVDGDGRSEVWVTGFEDADEGAGVGVVRVYRVTGLVDDDLEATRFDDGPR